MKQIITLFFIAFSTIFYGQKNEIKALEKALKKTDLVTAKASSNKAEALIDNMDDKTKAKFYFLKAQTYYNSDNAPASDIDIAIQSIEKLANIESKMGKAKYTEQANIIKNKIKKRVLTLANEAYESKSYLKAANGFKKIYEINPKDTLYLYNAAVTASKAEDYEKSLEYFTKLKNLGYTGVKTNYFAINKETKEEQFFVDKDNRDFAVNTLKTYINPTEKKEKSKRAFIVKNIALIYIFLGENEKALTAIENAKKETPDDYSLILAEANIYLKLENQQKAFELYKKAIAIEPNNPDLNFNVGVMTLNSKKYEDAKTYFNKAIELKPDYADAYLNLSTIEINKGNEINDQMNKLGSSNADNIKYGELKKEKNDFFIKAASVLEENYLSKFPKSKNIDIYQQLKNIFGALGQEDKYKKYKIKVEEIEMEAN